MAPKKKESQKRKATALQASPESLTPAPAVLKRPAGTQYADLASAHAAISGKGASSSSSGQQATGASEPGAREAKPPCKRPAGAMESEAAAVERSPEIQQDSEVLLQVAMKKATS